MPIVFVLSLIILGVVCPSFACRTLGPFNPEQKAQAETVFEGRAIAFRSLKAGESARVTFRVEKTVRGEKRERWELNLSSNTNTRVPRTLEQFVQCYGTRSEVGVVKGADGKAFRPVQGPCDPPYILNLTGSGSGVCVF